MADFILNVIADNTQATKAINDTAKSFSKISDASKKAGEDTKKSFKETGDAANTANDSLKKIPETVGKTVNSFAALRKEIKDYKAAALEAGETTPIGKQFIAKAAEATDRMNDLNQSIKNIASDTSKLDGLVGAGRAIAAGFSLAQGASALFGSSNKDLEKQLLKVQGAMAVLNGLTELQNAFQKESAIRILLTSAAQKAAAISTAAFGAATTAALGPIGLVIIATGALIAIFNSFGDTEEDITETTQRLNAETKRFYDLKIKIAELQGDETKAFKLKRQQDEETFAALQKELNLINEKAKTTFGISEEEAKRAKEIDDLQRDISDNIQFRNAERKEKEKKAQEELTDIITDIEKDRAEKEAENYKKLLALREDLIKIANEQLAKTDLERALLAEQEKFDALKKRAEGHTKELVEIERLRANAIAEVKRKANEDAQRELDAIVIEIEAENKKNKKEEEDAELEFQKRQAAFRKAALEEDIADNKAAEDAKRAIKQASLQNTIDIFASLAKLSEGNAEQQALFLEFQKIATIVQIAISTQEGIVKALAAYPGPIGIGFATLIGIKGALSAAIVGSQQPPQPPKTKGFHDGGYTGEGNEYAVAGVVHKAEFVSTAETTRKHRPVLEALHNEDYSRLTLPDLAPLLAGTGITLMPDLARNAINNHSQVKEQERAQQDGTAKELADIKKVMKAHFGNQETKPNEIIHPDGTRVIKKGSTTRIIRKR